MSTTPSQVFRALRLEQHFEPADVAACTGIPIERITKFELGALEPSLSELCALLVLYQCRFDTAFHQHLIEITAEVSARVNEYHPPESTGSATKNRQKNLLRLQVNLDRLHEEEH